MTSPSGLYYQLIFENPPRITVTQIHTDRK